MNDDPHDGNAEEEPGDAEADPLESPVDPGDPSAENVTFVVLGALLALFVLARIAGLV